MEDTTFWWPKNFYTGPKAKGFHIEPPLGGRAYEDWGNNTGVIWFQVFALNPPHSVDLQGCMAVPYGPAHTLLHLELVARGAATCGRSRTRPSALPKTAAMGVDSPDGESCSKTA